MPRKNPKTVSKRRRPPVPAARVTMPEKKPRATRAPAQRMQAILNIARIYDEVIARRPIEFRVPFARPDDLLVCDFIFDNLKLQSGKLVRKDSRKAATLIVKHQPQSFGEDAFLDDTGEEVASDPTEEKDKFDEVADEWTGGEDGNTDPPNPKNTASSKEPLDPLPSARIIMAGRSRVAFAMPAEETALDFTIEAVLDACRRWPMQLDVNAVPEPRPTIGELDPHVFDKNWLIDVTTSAAWAQATESLTGAMVQGDEVEQRLQTAAQRIARQSAAELNRARREGLYAELTRAMNLEIDRIGADFESVRSEREREIALGALAFMSASALAASDLQEFELGHVELLPFLPVFFGPHKPSTRVTALELPYRVMLSPVPSAHWRHALAPITHNGRTELWHTRLRPAKTDTGPDAPTKVRALWSPDYELSDGKIIEVVNKEPPVLRMSLDALDRKMLVRLMAGFDEPGFVPRTSRAERLSVSALGALLDAEGNWNPPPPDNVGLKQWRHLAALGRDHYVQVVYKGSLGCPGNEASLIKVTERKFEEVKVGSKTTRAAVLRQRFFIVPQERVRVLTPADHKFHGHNCPFVSIEILTRVTPNLRPPGEKENKLGPVASSGDPIYGVVPNRACFWPMVGPEDGPKDFLFDLVGTDKAGNRHPFSMPLLFIGIEANQIEDVMTVVRDRYNKEGNRRKTSFGNAAVCFAPEDAAAKGDTKLPTLEVLFRAGDPGHKSPKKPRYFPEIEKAQVGIAAIQRLLQKNSETVWVTYTDAYSNNGFGDPENPGEVFLKTLKVEELNFADGKTKSDTLGALATPSMAIQGISRIMGPVAAKPPANPNDPEQIEDALGGMMKNQFNALDFFQGAKILGGVDLGTIIGAAVKPLIGEDVPKLVSKQLADRFEARFDWKTNVDNSDQDGLFLPNPEPGAQTTLKMQGVMSAPLVAPAATTFDANAILENFKVNLFGFVTVWFDKLTFHSVTGSKPDVVVDLHPTDKAIEFGGALEFVNQLREIIPSNGFSDPPEITVTPSGIAAGFSVSVPSLAVGIFALEHLSLGAGFALPFDERPAEVRFNFSERQRPFSLTVSLLGGGGFFLIGLGTEGVREIEAALEFGAAVSINLGVASGGVEIKAGVYFHWLTESVELAGYVRLHGELDVLGLISASLTFNLQLAYLKDNKHSVVWGEATLVIEVEVLCFSADVSVKCRREFGGSDGDPKFIDLIPDQSTWDAYCGAFAEEVT
jgi:hypothetical protein